MKAAIIGAGAVAREHLDCLRAMHDVQIAGVCDLSAAMAESTAEEFGAQGWYTDHRAMLEQVQPDVVHVTTPPQTHFALAMDALEAGANVLVEKPITPDLGQMEELLARGRELSKIVIEDHNYQFNAPVQEIARLVDSGEFGEVTHVEVMIALEILGPGSRYTDPNLPHPSTRLPGGAIADFLTHLAYLAYAFVGPHDKLCTTWRKRDATSPLEADEFRALIEAERGSALLNFSAHTQPDAFLLDVFGTKMRARASLWEPLLSIEKLRGGPRPLMPVANGLGAARSYRRCAFGGLWRKLSGRPLGYEGLYELIGRLYRAVAEGGEAPIPAQQIEATNRLVQDLTKAEFRL